MAPSVGLKLVIVGLKIKLSPVPTNSCADIEDADIEDAVMIPETLIPEELNVSPVPTLMVSVIPFSVMLEDPTVRIPVTRAFPSTRRAVVPLPTVTVPDAFLIVVIPVSDKLFPKIVPV